VVDEDISLFSVNLSYYAFVDNIQKFVSRTTNTEDFEILCEDK
jgi:hypothetical protein